MADTSIDKLDIEINAEASKANDKIDELCDKITSLSKSISKFETGNFPKISKGIGEITSSLKGIEKVNTESFKNIANSINTLSKINADSLNSVSGSLKTLKSGLNEISGISFNTDGLDNVAESVRTFGYKTSTAGTANLSALKTDLLDFANGLNRIGSISFDLTGVENLVSNISRLGSKSVTQAVTNLRPLKEEMLSFVNGLNDIETLNFDISGITTIVSDISKLGGKSVTAAITNIPLLSTALNDMMATLSEAPAVSQNIIQMTNALANLAVQGSKVGSASNSIVKGLNRASSSATNAKKSFKGLASAFGTFYANCFLVIRGLKSLWSSIESTGDYLEAYNYFDVALAKAGNDWASQYEQYGYESAEAYANSFSTRLSEKLSGLSGVKLEISADGENGILTESNMKNLGLNIQEVTQYASQLASVTNSVGQVGEVSLATASAFTKLGADMSSLFNTDYSTVMNNLQSGLIGQSRALYKYGIDITNATLQTYAYELGVEKAVSKMTQAEKMQLRMIAILDQSRVSWGDQANTINSLSNSIRQFKNNISEIGQVLGQLFVPIMTKVMSVVNGVTIAVKRLLTSIAGMLGIKLNLGENLKTDDVAEEIGGISDSLDDATTSAENLKKATTTLGIDELNINSPQTDTSSGTSSSTGSSGGIDLTDDILSAMKEYENAWQEAYDNMVNEAEAFADRISNALEPVKKIFEDIAIGDWFAVGEDVSNLVVSIFDFFAKAIDEVDWYGIGTKIGDFLAGVEWTEVLSSVGDFIWEAIKASIELWTGAYDAAPIETAIITGIALLKFTGVGELIWKKIKEDIVLYCKKLVEEITLPAISFNLPTISVNMSSGAFQVIGTEIFDKLDQAIEELLPDWAYEFLCNVGAGIVLGAAAGSWFPGAGTVAGAIIGAIIGGLSSVEIDGVSILSTIVDKIFNFDSTLFFFEEAKKSFETAFDRERDSWLEVGGWILKGIGEGFVGALQFLVEPIQDFFTWTWETICEVFGIHSPAKEMKPLGENILLGVIAGFKNAYSELKKKLLEIKEKIVEKFQEAKENASEKIEELKENVSEKLEDMKENATSKFETMRSNLATKVESIRSNATSKFETMKNEVTSKLNTLKSNASTAFESIRSTISGIVEKIKSILDGFKSTIEGVINKLSDFFGFSGKGFSLSLPTDIFSSFSDAVSGAISKLKDFFGYDGKSVNVSSNVTSTSSSSSSGSNSSKVTVKAYATGGFPEDGWFRASKGEYFGQFDDGTSYIANNNQITSGVASGVKQAVREAMSEMYPYLADIAQNTRETADKEVSVNIGDREIYKASVRGSKEYGRLLIT